MANNLESDRLNIRIEIPNNIPEAMDIDEFDENKSEEEGEIRDTSTSEIIHPKANHGITQDEKYGREDLGHFISLDQKKLQDRALRFSLKPEEINTFTEEDLNELYVSLGISSVNVDQIRFEAVHLRSSDELTLKDVTTYFMKFAPNTVEMIDAESYNVVWDNKLSAARALFLVSQVVRGMPVRVVSEHVIDSFILDEPDADIKEPAFHNKDREVELTDESSEAYNKLLNDNSADISTINIPIPPGYWRLGRENIHSYSVLLRFSMVTDKKPTLVEKCSKYLKSSFLRDRSDHQSKGIFSRNKDIKAESTNKDPWGVLAKTWNEDYKFREQERFEDNLFIGNKHLPPLPVNPELRGRLTAKRRLGIKQNIHAEQSSPEKDQSEESDQENVKKVSKVPRMRMYADEEEEKIKRKKLLQTLKKQSEKIEKTVIPNTDLRNILGITNRRAKTRYESNGEVDLSVNLKNRRNKLIFTVAQDDAEPRLEHRNRAHLERNPTNERIRRSPIRFKKHSPEIVDSFRRESSKVHQRSVRRHTRKVSVGGMYSERQDDDNYYSHKPKSKVALVIKTQKKPTVASAIRSRNRNYDTSSSSDEDSSSESSESEDSSESNSSSSEDSDNVRKRKHHSQIKGHNHTRVKREYERR